MAEYLIGLHLDGFIDLLRLACAERGFRQCAYALRLDWESDNYLVKHRCIDGQVCAAEQVIPVPFSTMHAAVFGNTCLAVARDCVRSWHPTEHQPKEEA